MTNVAVVGLGAAARTIWAPALAKVRGAVLVAGADPDTRAQGAWARTAPRAAPHPNLEELFDSHQSIDWLVVASPPPLHEQHVRAGLAAGCNVLCEKPVVRTSEALGGLRAAAREAGRHIAVNHEFTWMPILAASLAQVHGAEHGRLRFAQVWQTVDDRGASGWRASGRTFAEFGTHAVDLLIEAFGGAPSTVSARMPRPDGGKGDPIDLVTLEWPDGRAAHVVLDRISPGKHQYFESRFDCEHASIRASIGGRAQVRMGIS
ncbi:MAG: Gfo/Idh/MocA family oxidoreductase, partial [Deltaproteobacteria bacterium]|nr:Gfo/Idh/MocA family oxidoreductase [Deltaproteobacteria bacterium]